MMSFLMFVAGLAVGLAAPWLVLPRLQQRFPALFRSVGNVVAELNIVAPSPLQAKIEAAIAEIQQQIRGKHDVERNQVRLAQLREVLES